MGENNFAPLPMALYGAVLLLAAIAYYLLQRLIVARQGKDSKLAASIGRDVKGKLSPILYAAGIVLSFFRSEIAGLIYVLAALLWLVPDRRLRRAVEPE
jgi:TMEM175 potassium channel family protein